METKLCQTCQTVKPIEDFGMRSKTSKYRVSRCRPCCVKKSVEYAQRPENVERVARNQKRSQVKRHYGLTWEQYLEMAAEGCAVCGTTTNLCVDHDHNCCPGVKTCGKCIRGVLCNKHNKILGYVQDSMEELSSLVDYLASYKNA